MPPSRTRRSNLQGRQRSCSECAKGKRKCDLELPVCTRCRKQQLTCLYPLQPNTARSHSPSPDIGGTTDTHDDFEIPLGFNDPISSNFFCDFDVAATPGVTDINLSTEITSLDPMADSLYKSQSGEDQMAIERASQHVTNSFPAVHITPFARSRIEWSIEQLKLAPHMMVHQNGTPWQHPRLYEERMPRSLQDAHGACALYLSRNDSNHDFIARHIAARVEDLIACPVSHEPAEVLAQAHATMLYQAMLIFGGDNRLYGQAQKLMSHMEELGDDLHLFAIQQVDPKGKLPLYPSSAARAAWASYIFRESLRRTLLSLHHFAAMCSVLHGQLKSCSSHLAMGNRVTLCAQLWNAENAFDFAMAWNNKRHFLVKELDFTEFMRDARPDDADEFTKMMMIGLQGIDDIRGWFYTKGGVL